MIDNGVLIAIALLAFFIVTKITKFILKLVILLILLAAAYYVYQYGMPDIMAFLS